MNNILCIKPVIRSLSIFNVIHQCGMCCNRVAVIRPFPPLPYFPFSELSEFWDLMRSCRHLRHSIPICFWRATYSIPRHLYSRATRHISSIWLKPSPVVRMDWTGTKVLVIPYAVPFTKTPLETAKVLKWYTMVLCPVSKLQPCSFILPCLFAWAPCDHWSVQFSWLKPRILHLRFLMLKTTNVHIWPVLPELLSICSKNLGFL